MAGQADRSAAGRTGPVSRRPAGRGRSSSNAPKLNSVPVPVGGDETAQATEAQVALSLAAPLGPDLEPREIRTQAAYRLLVADGIAGADATALIGYVVGLSPRESRWSLKQINRLLFLRNLYSSTEWGDTERQPA
jgi:hypothetical protein